MERRDNTSSDLLAIAAREINKMLGRISAFANAKKIGAYYSIGSEIPTHTIIRDLLSDRRHVFLPRVEDAHNMTFRRVTDFSSLERHGVNSSADIGIGISSDIMEPKQTCPVDNDLDVILVPTVCISEAGARLGYGQGFYDHFLAGRDTTTISLTLEKQLVHKIPKFTHDVPIDWIVTEDRILCASANAHS